MNNISVPPAPVLVADDDPLIRRMIRSALELDGWSVVEAEDGSDAIAVFQRASPGIILLDVLMPCMNGFEACEAIKGLPDGKETPILMVTALNDTDAIKRAFAAGAEDFITKPVQWEVLRHRVRRLMQMRELKAIAAQERLASEHAHLRELEQFMMSISTQFIDLDPADVDPRIAAALCQIGEFIRVDRAYLCAFYEGGMRINCPHEWCAPGVPSKSYMLQRVPVMLFPGWYDRLSQLDTIRITSLDELPSFVRAERKFLEARQCRSALLVPVSSKGRLAGFIGFETTHAEKVWLDQDIALVKMAGEIFITALEHKRTEEALQSNERELRQITDTMLDAVYRADANGIIEFASPSCWHVFGYPPESLLRTSVFQHVHPDDIEAMRAGMFNTGSAEHRYFHANGSVIWLETLCNLIFTEEGQVEGIVLASRDVTQRKRAQHELQELNRLKTEFLSTAAHELRTPLTSIRGFSELLLSRNLDADRQKRFLTMINEQATRLGKLIDDLLDISRLEAKRNLTLAMEPVDMGVLIAQALSPFQESSPQHRFVLDRCPSYPPVLGDAVRLTQVVENLLSNARKYSPNGGMVAVRVASSDVDIHVSVQDEGIGMALDEQEHLFEKFYRANASNTATNGTGLGLSISKLIVELHGGAIWAESEPGKGSTFHFTLPLMLPNLGPESDTMPHPVEKAE